MRKTVSALLVSTFVLTACGAVRDSRVNPFNWFGDGRSEPVNVQSTEAVNPLIPPQRTGIIASAKAKAAIYQGQPIDVVSSLIIERVPGGAIIRVTGVSNRQGVYDVRLTPENEEETAVDGVLSYRLEGVRSANGRPSGGPATREVIAARRVTDQELSGARTIRVSGVENAQTARR